MRPGSARKPCSPGAGRDAAADCHGRSGTNASKSACPSLHAICPARGVGAGLVLPRLQHSGRCNGILMKSRPGSDMRRAHAVLIIDRAGWHHHRQASRCRIQHHIDRSPATKSARAERRSKTYGSSCAITGFPTGYSRRYDDIVALCCEAWNKLIDQPWKIMSIGRRKWAHGF